MLDKAIAAEEAAVEKHKTEKVTIQEEIDQSQEAIVELQGGLKDLKEVLDSRTKELDVMKKNASKASKALDQVLKEISLMVSTLLVRKCTHSERLSDPPNTE